MKTPKFSGPFKWGKVRNQLLSLREDVQIIQKIAGRNVTLEKHPGKGTVINVEREPRAFPVCGACSLPDCECPHAMSCEIKFDAEDTADTDFLEVANRAGSIWLGAYKDSDGAGGYNFHVFTSGGAEEAVVNVSGTGFFDVWHSVCVQFCKSDETNVTATITVDGVSSDPAVIPVPQDGDVNMKPDTIFVGSRFGSGSGHRSIRCATVLKNPGTTEQAFYFPVQSFTSLTTGATVSGGVLRIDSDTDAYGEKDLTKGYNLTCTPSGACCIDAVCSIKTEAACMGAGGTFHGDDTTCDPDPCAECIHDDTLCVTFAGIETCHCYFNGGSTFLEISDVSMNGSFTLTKTGDSGGVVQWEGAGGTVHLKKWTDGICSGTPVDECDCVTTYIIIQCIGPPTSEDISHFIGYFVLSGDVCDSLSGTINLFQSGATSNGNVPFGVAESNINNCVTTTHGIPLGQNGTVTIESGAC